jgi:putative hemolysin
MTQDLWTYLSDFTIIFCLILLNGFFAMSELAVVSCRRPRLKVLVDEKHWGACSAWKLVENPARFLSTVQVGITLVGIFAGVYGGEEFAPPLGQFFSGIERFAPFAEELAVFVVVSGITYLSIIVGELVPKQLALKNPERIASALAPPMIVISLAFTPIVLVLERSARLLLWIFRASRTPEQAVTEEEVRAILAEGVSAGVLKPAEKEMIGSVMRFADWQAGAIMTPRAQIEWIDLDEEEEDIRRQIQQCRYWRVPVAAGDLDNLEGIVQAKDLLDELLAGAPLDLKRVLRRPLYVPPHMQALHLLEQLKRSPVHLAIVIDEHGGVEGLVTLTDVLSALVGELAEPGEARQPEAVRREDGSWLIDGDLHIDVLRDLLDLRQVPGKEEFHTTAGFMLFRMEKVPTAGEFFEWEGFRFEVVDMDGKRIDKILVTPTAQLN